MIHLGALCLTNTTDTNPHDIVALSILHFVEGNMRRERNLMSTHQSFVPFLTKKTVTFIATLQNTDKSLYNGRDPETRPVLQAEGAIG